jgi:hypothetical protein
MVGIVRDGSNRAANAVRVRALPGFKSPSRRPLTSASTEIPDPGGGAGFAFGAHGCPLGAHR